ncbi:hypothetical protein JRQ81_020055 [Phrynocephalus forsythii]|uniref:Protein SON n=1 Tax=Phrynocephalus forsythii TaxID=171643 RepID=A0A9Q1AYJ8_9SAUR|nr:hypothetical protein JRQ81_020055 [Phrynocephalus forsythii]
MATSIEHIFRSFVITKFREIQGQQFGGGNAVSQHNGEINSPDRVNPSDDTIPSIGNLQNDPLVQKIEQVLSEVLSAESQYKPDGGGNIVRTKSAKRGLSEEVQDEIPRKKSKKDKKHKDKKKKKKRKKEKKDKKYKKQSKDSKLNEKEDESGDLKYDVRSEPENSVAVLSAEDDVDTQLISPETQLPAWTQEKTAYENGNTAMSNSHGTDIDRNRSDMSKEHTTSVSIEDPARVEVVNERELGNGPCQPASVTSLLTEDEFLNIGNAVGSDLCLIGSRTSNMEQTEVSSVLETTEEINIAESGPHFLRGEQGYLKTSLESGMLEVKRLDLVTESLNSESTKPSASASSEMYLQPSVEAGAEGKDSVTTLGFLAKVVGKDFEATSELLNTTKVKASEITLKHIIDMKNAAIPDSERLVTTQDLQKALQLNSRAELKDLPSPESQHGVFEKSSKPISVMEPKLQQELKRTVESDAPKCTDVARDAETEPETKTLTETHVSGMIMELKESEKYPRHLQTIIDGKDIRRTQELQVTNRKDLASSVPDIAVKAVVAVRNIDPAPECEESVQMSCLAPSMEAVIKEKAMIEVDVPKTISQLEDVSEVRGLKTIPESADTMKPQNLEVSKCIIVREVEHEAVVNLKDLKKGSDSPVTVKSAECTSESQYVKGILQSATVAQIKDVHASLELEGEKDIDASSDSLHMIFANYSEPNLELYAEPAVVLKNSKGVPESHVMVGAEFREEQHISKSKELTSVESEINDGLNNLHKNIECFHNNEKNVEAILESKALPTGKHSDTLETVSKEGIMDTASHFEAGIEQNTPDTQEYMEKNQHDAEAADLHVLSRCQKVIKTGSKGRAENELFAGSESLLVTSESTQETNTLKSRMVPELKTIAATQELKEVVGFATRMGASSPEEKMEFQISESSGPKHFSTLISAIKQAESVAESGAEQNEESLPQTNTGIKKINLESTYDLDIKQMRASPAFLFSEDLKNQEEKQRWEERTERAGMTTAPVVVSESSTINKSVESEYHPASVHLGSINSENILKPLYSIQVKDTQTISESKIIDAKILETDSGATFQAGAEITGLREGELKAPSEIETVSETQKKNEMPHGLQTIPVSQESNETFRSKMPTITNLSIHSEILCEFDTGNLELPSQCEELEIVKKSEGDKPSLSVADIVDRKVSSSFVCSTENEQLNAVKADETVGAVEKSKASTEYADILEETFESTCMTDLKDLEGSQKLETHPESYIYTGSSTGTKDSATLKNEARLISESVLEATSKGGEECSGVDLEPSAKLVVKYSESVSDSVTVSEKVDDMSMTVFMVDVTDLEASSSCLDTRQTSNSETTIWIETTSAPICALLSRDSDGEVESVSKIETKDSGQAVSSAEALELKGAAASATQLNILDLESSESISVAEVIGDLKTTPTCLDAVDLKISGTIAKAKALEVIDSETNLKPENASEVKLLETTLETETIIEKAAKLVSEKISNVEELKSISEPKHVEAAHSSEKQSQLQLHVEGKGSEITVESARISDLRNTTVLMDTAPFAGGKSPKPNSLVDVKNSNDIEAANKCTFLQEVGDLPGVSSSTGEKLQTLESQELEQNSTSGLLLEKELSKVSVESSHTVYTNDSEPVPESINAKSADIAEKSKCMSLTKVKDLEPTTEHTVLAKTKNSEMISQFTVKVSDPETMLGSLSTAKEKDLGGVPHISLDVQGLKTAVKPVCTATENLEANQQVPPVLKDSGTALECVQLVEGDLKASEKGFLEVKDLEPTVESMQKEKDKDLEATIEDSVNDQDSKGAPKSLDIMKEDEESTLKDKKSEKTSSKSKDKSKSGKKAKKSRSKSLSKSKKRKKKSRSRSVSRQVSARRARSRSKNDSDSRKKLSTSRHKSRSKSADRKGKESSLRSSRRHSRSPDRLKSRSKSVDRRETSVRSRRRRSRSSDHRKSRSRSVDRKESVRRRLSQSSDNHRSRSRSVDRRETLVRSRWRRSRSSDHRKSRSRSVDRRETSVRRRRGDHSLLIIVNLDQDLLTEKSPQLGHGEDAPDLLIIINPDPDRLTIKENLW